LSFCKKVGIKQKKAYPLSKQGNVTKSNIFEMNPKVSTSLLSLQTVTVGKMMFSTGYSVVSTVMIIGWSLQSETHNHERLKN
jgi:hypothetical protein